MRMRPCEWISAMQKMQMKAVSPLIAASRATVLLRAGGRFVASPLNLRKYRVRKLPCSGSGCVVLGEIGSTTAGDGEASITGKTISMISSGDGAAMQSQVSEKKRREKGDARIIQTPNGNGDAFLGRIQKEREDWRQLYLVSASALATAR